MISREDAINGAFNAIDRHLRKSSIAQIGGFRPSDSPCASWFGGKFLGLPHEVWPENEHGCMVPLLQVRTDELPYCPVQLGRVALFTVFSDCKSLPIELPAKNGDQWLIRCYDSVDGLVPLSSPDQPKVRAFPIKWSLSEAEGPLWQDAWSIHDLSAFNELEDCISLFYDRYSNHSSTKIGGWPSYIQSSLSDSNEFVFQIGSEEKPNWMWGDNGNAYFFFNERTGWSMDWDCY